jgi:hypothetical protein
MRYINNSVEEGTMNRRAAALAFVVMIGASAAAAAQETVLYSFGVGRDGRNPQAGLIADADGVLYGTTKNGGVHRHGTVFSTLAATDGPDPVDRGGALQLPRLRR